jgi:hypothetical protein
MHVPRLMAPGLTFGAALSNTTHERPCASFPVTTRLIGLGSSDICYVSCSDFPASSAGRLVLDPNMLKDNVGHNEILRLARLQNRCYQLVDRK